MCVGIYVYIYIYTSGKHRSDLWPRGPWCLSPTGGFVGDKECLISNRRGVPQGSAASTTHTTTTTTTTTPTPTTTTTTTTTTPTHRDNH